MRRYEVVFALAPRLTEEEVDQQVDGYSSLATEQGASVLDIEKWGKRRLAYPVEKNSDAYYVVLTLEEEASAAVTELERRFRVTDSIIRFLSVRIDADLKRQEKHQRRREHRIAARASQPKASVAVATAQSAPRDVEEGEGEDEG